jgi:hypothetical protein
LHAVECFNKNTLIMLAMQCSFVKLRAFEIWETRLSRLMPFCALSAVGGDGSFGSQQTKRTCIPIPGHAQYVRAEYVDWSIFTDLDSIGFDAAWIGIMRSPIWNITFIFYFQLAMTSRRILLP